MARAQMQLFFAKNGAIAYQTQKKRETKKFSLIILCNIGTKKFGRKTQNFTVKIFGRKVQKLFFAAESAAEALRITSQKPTKQWVFGGFEDILSFTWNRTPIPNVSRETYNLWLIIAFFVYISTRLILPYLR